MKTWKTEVLADVAQVFNGKTPSKSEQRREGHPVLKIRDVSELGEFRGEFQSFVDPVLAARLSDRHVKEGDILILNAAHNSDHVASKTYRAKLPTEGALATGEWLIIRPKTDSLNPNFTYHWATSVNTRQKIRELVHGIHLYPKDVSRLQIPVPPLPEQRRIADILDRADSLRAKRRAALAQLELFSESLFSEMFGDLTSNSMGWSDGRVLGEITEIVPGITKGRPLNGQTARPVSYLAVLNVQDRFLNLATVKTIEATETEISRYRLARNDLLLTEGGDPDKLGRGTLWQEQLPECIHQNHIFRIRLQTDDIDPIFLNWLVGSRRGKRYFARSAKQTTGIATINSTQLRQFPLLVPPLALQIEFRQRLAKVNAVKAVMAQTLAEFEGLSASLQWRAFRGEL